MATIQFNVLEKADATGMFIYKTGGVDVVEGAILTTTLPDNTSEEYPFLAQDAIDFNAASPGLELSASDAIKRVIFEDGIYKFEIESGLTPDEGEHTEGFSAIITSNVIKDALAYRFYDNRATKEYIQEKMRLLNNLAYAASVGAEAAFNTNLSMLERMR
jgi:hypothetical protein